MFVVHSKSPCMRTTSSVLWVDDPLTSHVGSNGNGSTHRIHCWREVLSNGENSPSPLQSNTLSCWQRDHSSGGKHFSSALSICPLQSLSTPSLHTSILALTPRIYCCKICVSFVSIEPSALISYTLPDNGWSIHCITLLSKIISAAVMVFESL